MRDLNCLRRYFLTAVVLVFAATGTAAAQPKTAPRLRVIVKVRAKLAKDVEASLPMQTMVVTAGQSASTSVQSFMNRHKGHRLAPIYPGIVRAKKQRGVTDLEIATSVRQKFPIRANRLRASFRPPEISRTYILEVDSTDKTVLDKLLSDLKADPDVEFAEPDHLVSVRVTPNDPYFFSSGTWGQSYDDLWGIKKIGAPAAWDTSTGAGVTVAVVDTGLDYTHPDIVGNVWTNTREVTGNGIDDDGNGYVDDTRGWDFIGSDYLNPTQSNDPTDHHGHGTHVAGTIAATGNNGIGVIGVAWQAQVMPVKGLDDQGIGLDSTLGPAILYAANNGADVISNSWAGTGTSQTIAEAVDYAYNLGVVVVAAAGNNNDDAMNYYPANLSEVITVAASDSDDGIAYFSNWGTKIDIAAPGVDILSLRAAGTSLGSPVDDYYTRSDGTSMATPHVSGLAALILSQHPDYINEDVRQAVRASASDLGETGFDQTFGYGRIDATAALALPDVLQCKIKSPINSTHVNVPTVISGVVQGSAFSRYVLEYGAGYSPTSWVAIQTGTSPVAGGALGTFDASTLGDGVYTIRLTAYDLSNRAFVDRITLVIDYISISSPLPPAVPATAQEFKPGTIIPIQGTASGATFQDFRMQWAEGINPTSGWSSAGITLVGGGLSPVSNGPLGAWDTSSITKADYYTLQLLVDNSGFFSPANTLVYLEPDLLSANWPKWLDEVPGQFSGIVPAADGAGNVRLALSIPTYSNSVLPPRLRTFSADGSVEQSLSLNFGDYFQPAAADFDGDPGEELVTADSNMLRIIRSDNTSNTFTETPTFPLWWSQIVLADLDGDSQLEALGVGTDFTGNGAYIFAWRRDGQQAGANFPIAIADQNERVGSPSCPRVLAGDIDGDGKPEIIVQEGTSPSSFTLGLFGNDGLPKPWAAQVFPGYPYQMALADLDHDGKLEVLMISDIGSASLLHVLQSDGSERPGWPFQLPYRGSSYIAVGDLNLDGREDIVVAQGPVLYVFNPDGTSFSSAWPLWTSYGFGPVAIADVDGDGYPEIVTASLESFATSNPLFPAASGQAMPVVASDKAIVLQNARISAGAQGATNLQYWETDLHAFRRDGTSSKSWRLLGANGNQPWFPVIITVGDFNKDGITDIAATYDIVVASEGNSLSQGVATVLSTGAPFHPSVNDWPMIYQNPRNTATMIRDHKPPSVWITSPAGGAAVGGSVTIAATASDNVGVTSVQFLVDGVNLGTADTTAPFSTVWNTSGFSSGSHTLTAIASDAAGNVTTSAPVAVVAGVPKAAFSPTALVYGSQLVGTSSSARNVTLTSTGSATVSISGITVTGDFSQTNNCGNALLPGAVCTVKVTFKPTTRGKRSGSVILNSNISGTAPSISLSGTEIGPVVSVSPGSLSFAPQVVNTTSSAKSVTLTNTGETTLHIVSISTSGDFSQSNKCGALLAGAKCTINVTFKPTAYGTRAGSLMIADDASGSPQNFGLSGTGLDYSLSSSPSSVTVNSGSSALYVINVKALGGTFSSAVSLSCSGLPAASTCLFSHASVVPGATSANSTMTVATTKRHGNSGTPAGTYTVTVKGTSGSTQHSINVKLIVN